MENLAPFELKTLTLWRVNLRVQMFHVRFILHRPYMNGAATNGSGPWSSNGQSAVRQASGSSSAERSPSVSSPRSGLGPAASGSPSPNVGTFYNEGATVATTPSYEAAVHSADMVIQLVSDVSIQLLGQDSYAGDGMGFLGVPGHIAWSVYHRLIFNLLIV